MESFFIFTWLGRFKWFFLWIQDYFLYLLILGKHLILLIQCRLPLKVKIIKYSFLNKYYNTKILQKKRLKGIRILIKEVLKSKQQEKLTIYEAILLFQHYYNERGLTRFSIPKFSQFLSKTWFFYIYLPLCFLYYNVWHPFCILFVYPLWDLFLKVIFLFNYLFILWPLISAYALIIQGLRFLKKIFFKENSNIFLTSKIFKLCKYALQFVKTVIFNLIKKIINYIKQVLHSFFYHICNNMHKLISLYGNTFFKDYYSIWTFLKNNFFSKLKSSLPLDKENLRYDKSKFSLPFWYPIALKWFIFKNYTLYSYKTKISFYSYKYIFIAAKNKNDQWFSIKKLSHKFFFKIKGFYPKLINIFSLLSLKNLINGLYSCFFYISLPKSINRIMSFEWLLKIGLILPWYYNVGTWYWWYHEAPYEYIKTADGTQAIHPPRFTRVLETLTYLGDKEEEELYRKLVKEDPMIHQDYMDLWSCDELLHNTDPYLPFSFVLQIFLLIVTFLICFSRYWRTLFLPFLPQIFVDKYKFFTRDPFDRLQEIKNTIFKTNYTVNLNLKKYLDESTIDLTRISLKEFIQKGFSFSQLWDVHNELHTYVLEGRLELRNNIYYKNFFREYDIAINKYDQNWLNNVSINYDKKINQILCEYDYVERAFLNVNRLLLQTNISNLSSIKYRYRKHLRPFFLDSFLRYEDDRVFFEKIFKDDLQYVINKFRYKNQYLVKELTHRYYSIYKEYLPFTTSNLDDWVWNLPLNNLSAKLSLNPAKTSYVNQSMNQHLFLDDESVELNNFTTHYDNWVEVYDEEMDPDAEWYNSFVDPKIPTAMSEELDELELPSPGEYDHLMKDMFWKNFNIFTLFTNFKNFLEVNYSYNFLENNLQNNTDLNWLANRQIDFLNNYYKTTDYYKNLPKDMRWQKERISRTNDLKHLFRINLKKLSYKDFNLADWKVFNNFNFWLGDRLITDKVLFRNKSNKFLTQFGIEEASVLAMWLSFFVVPYLILWKNGMWYLLAHSYVDMLWYWWEETYLYGSMVYEANLGGLIEETNDDSFERFYPFWNFPVENRIHNDMIHKPTSWLHDTLASYWSLLSNWVSCWYVYLQVLAEKRLMYHLFEVEENNRKIIFEGYRFIAQKGPVLDLSQLDTKRPFIWSWNHGIYDKYIEYYETEAYDLLFLNVFKHLLVEIKQYIKYVRSIWTYKYHLIFTNFKSFLTYHLGDNFVYNFYLKLKYAYDLRYYRYMTDMTYRYCSNKWWLFPADDFTNNMSEVKNNFFFKLFQYDPAQLNEKRVIWKLKPIYKESYMNPIPHGEIKQHEYFLNGLYIFLWWSIIIVPYIYWLVFSDWVQTNRYRYVIKRFVPKPHEHWMLYMDDLWIDYNEWDLANSASYDPYAFLALERNGELRSFLDLNPYLGSRFHYSWHPLRLLKSDLGNKAINNIEEKLNLLNGLEHFLKSENTLHNNLLLNQSVLKNNLKIFEKEYEEQISCVDPSLVDLKSFDDYHNMVSQVNKQYIKDIAWKQRLYRSKLYLYKRLSR